MLALNTKGINLSRIYSLKALKYGLYQATIIFRILYKRLIRKKQRWRQVLYNLLVFLRF